MKKNVAILAAAALWLVAPARAGAAGADVRAAVSVWPSHLSLVAGARESVTVANPGTAAAAVVVDVGQAGYAVDARGRPRVAAAAGGRSAAGWLLIEPRRLTLRPHQSATFVVSAAIPRSAEPGDHLALVLLTTRPTRVASVAMRMRVGIVVTARAGGRIVHRVSVAGLRVRQHGSRRFLELVLANTGNVTETTAGTRITLHRGGHVLATLRAAVRDVPPRTRIPLAFAPRLHGAAVAVVSGGRLEPRSFRVRL